MLCLGLQCLELSASENDLDEADDRLASGYLARIEPQTPEALFAALQRAEMLFFERRLSSKLPPAAIVVNGPEVAVFLRENYRKYKQVADLAARLSAFGVVNILVCERRMDGMGREASQLYPFVGTVPFGPDEVKRLVGEEQYLYF